MRGLLIALILVGCTAGGGTGLDLPLFDVVYECRGAGAVVEHCYDGDPQDMEEALGMTCEPTPRHLGPCLYCCGDGCTRGSNALNGCWCPAEEIP